MDWDWFLRGAPAVFSCVDRLPCALHGCLHVLAAYTIITIKARYSKAASKLLAITSSPNPSQQEALLRVQELEQCTAEALGLVPQKVVEQVRARERALQAEMSATRPSSPP